MGQLLTFTVEHCDSHSTAHHEIVLSDIVVTAFTSFTIRFLANNVYN